MITGSSSTSYTGTSTATYDNDSTSTGVNYELERAIVFLVNGPCRAEDAQRAIDILSRTPDPTEDVDFRVHKDPFYLQKRRRFERWTNYIHKLMIARMFNVNHAVLFRRCGLSKSGWLARVGKRKKGV